MIGTGSGLLHSKKIFDYLKENPFQWYEIEIKDYDRFTKGLLSGGKGVEINSIQIERNLKLIIIVGTIEEKIELICENLANKIHFKINHQEPNFQEATHQKNLIKNELSKIFDVIDETNLDKILENLID
jgi:hypothetical protein